MAHASPASGTPGTPGESGTPDAPRTAATPGAPGTPEVGTPSTPELPDVLSERAHTVVHRSLPVALGLVYGYWAAAVNRDDVPGAGATAGSITGWNLLFGFVTAFVFMALYSTVRAVAPRLRREQRALLWSAFTGIAFGFLYSQAEVSVERSAVMALLVAAPVFAVSFYRYSTHGDAEGHRLR